jgi:Flp pilus assembly protein protease CpaA
MYEIIFLSALAIVWILFAVVQDLKTREIANWLNFSLIIFALGFRFFYSLFGGEFGFFYQGIYGLGVFFIIGNLFYYGRIFAGGDAKLMIALGAILPFHNNFYDNLNFFLIFLMIFLFVGAIYTLIGSLWFTLINFKSFKKEFRKQLMKFKKYYSLGISLAVLLALLGFMDEIFLSLGVLFFVFINLYIYAKAVDESSMIRNVGTGKLTEGDWLYKNTKVGKKTIKASWEGLKKQEIRLLKKYHKKIRIRYGIPFSPVFLISFLILIWFWKIGLRNPFW